MTTPPLTLTSPSAAQCAPFRASILSPLWGWGRCSRPLFPSFPSVRYSALSCPVGVPSRRPDTVRHAPTRFSDYALDPQATARLALNSQLSTAMQMHSKSDPVRPHPTPILSLAPSGYSEWSAVPLF